MIQIRTPNIRCIAKEFFDIVNPFDKETGILVKTERFDKNSVIVKIYNSSKDNDLPKGIQDFYEYILDNVDHIDLFSGTKEKLNEIIRKIEKKFDRDFFNTIISPKFTYKDHVLKIFSYKEFRSSENAFWFAEKLNIKVCPYCNREYTFRFPIFRHEKQNNKLKFQTNKKVLFDFDHFLSKEKYPYLSLSFFNLVPSCSICNSRFKHTTEFDFDNYIYPYEENFENEIKFKIKLKKKEDFLIDFYKEDYKLFMNNNVKINFNKNTSLDDLEKFENLMKEKTKEWIERNEDQLENEKFKEYYSKHFGTSFFYGNLKSFEIDLVENNPQGDSEIQKKIEKAKNNIRVFRLKEVYNQNKDIAMEIFQKSLMYSDEYLESLFKQYEGTLFKNLEQLKGLVLGNYISDDELSKRPLSKLTRDIAEELGLV